VGTHVADLVCDDRHLTFSLLFPSPEVEPDRPVPPPLVCAVGHVSLIAHSGRPQRTTMVLPEPDGAAHSVFVFGPVLTLERAMDWFAKFAGVPPHNVRSPVSETAMSDVNVTVVAPQVQTGYVQTCSQRLCITMLCLMQSPDGTPVPVRQQQHSMLSDRLCETYVCGRMAGTR
jgi:hypothetical protein